MTRAYNEITWCPVVRGMMTVLSQSLTMALHDDDSMGIEEELDGMGLSQAAPIELIDEYRFPNVYTPVLPRIGERVVLRAYDPPSWQKKVSTIDVTMRVVEVEHRTWPPVDFNGHGISIYLEPIDKTQRALLLLAIRLCEELEDSGGGKIEDEDVTDVATCPQCGYWLRVKGRHGLSLAMAYQIEDENATDVIICPHCCYWLRVTERPAPKTM